MSNDKRLRISDMVWWRGSWGQEPPRTAIVTAITLTSGYDKDGVEYPQIEWSQCNDRKVIVDLNNGHWAYGFQLLPVTDQEYEDIAHENFYVNED
jgi:hypothetical protein